jgi:S1-C subfamily serine protease
MKLFSAGFFVLTTFQLSTVWGRDCSPKYFPSGQIKKIDVDGLSLNITVEDSRDDKEKYFFLWTMGWKSWDSDATKFNRGQKLFLTSKPKDIVKEALSDSFLNAGYKDSNQTEDITLRFKLNKFLYTFDTWKYKDPFAEISLKVLVEKNGQCCFTKEFFCHSDKPVNLFRQIEDAEPVLSKCLSKMVEDVAMDEELKLAIFKAYGVTAKVKEDLKQPVETPKQPAESPRPPKNIDVISTGTCFLVSNKGFVCTNYHVVHGATNITVVFPSINKRFPANIEIQDISTDLVILRLDGFDCNSLNICGIPYGIRSSSEVKLAEKAFTIGYPLGDTLGKSPKFTEGSISSLCGIQDNANLFQISIPVQPGNSGGPLFDKDGNVIGIIVAGLNTGYLLNTGIIPQNVNFAIKSDYLKILLSSISDCKDVKDRKGTLKGVDTQDQVEKLKVIVGQVFAQ